VGQRRPISFRGWDESCPTVMQKTIDTINRITISMIKAYKYRIYPTKSQRTKMERTLDLCRWTYNQTLAYQKNAWENEGKSVSKYETHDLLPDWKSDKPELSEVFSQTLQNVQERVDLALKAFFRRV
jgi:putative transposase